MKHTCHWHDDAGTIQVITALPNATWNDAYRAVEDQMAYIASVTHGVYTIYDLRLSAILPQGVAFPNLQRLISQRQPNQTLTIFVGTSYLAQRFMEIARNMFGLSSIFSNFHFVATLEEALQLIDSHKKQSRD